MNPTALSGIVTPIPGDDFVVIGGDKTGEPNLEARSFRCRALLCRAPMFQEGDPFFDLVDRDDRQEHPAFATHTLQPLQKSS